MARKLVVTHPFGDRNIGDEITDAEEVASVLETHRHAVVPVDHEPEPVEAKAADESGEKVTEAVSALSPGKAATKS